MKNKLKLLAAPMISLAFFACKSEKTSDVAETTAIAASTIPDTHNSQNSLDWNGVYQGVVPCADCEGIETRITLKSDGTFLRSLKYLGKDPNAFFDQGNLTWDTSGSKIRLTGENGETQMYQVGENVLFHLDKEGNRITGDLADNYKLIKNPTDPRIEGKKWVLVELRGKPVVQKEGSREGFIQFDMETSSASGNSTCNGFSGGYELKGQNQITFGNIAGTMMACPDMETEQAFYDVLKQTDNYSVADTIMTLNKAKMAPLAKFVLKIQ
ncbi:copper resistance protein NlpE N-terminal domain-containing protein [Mariniradius sediminis]|uniref:Copper resistance protein NlpE N-terminal domain-containing protein n=1 Tax=Mariniradius sediminis TaxID=2909237 RepID=A0ABS9BWT4_9BACT|nr:copper resistance protein NlpE N-terminal domain-containing protein [Mariniradius sediminis]MCF1751744.1 copper resistance protein NlpE N-terminal domain-containing protein [Mariniradius sediminis]